MCLIFSQSLLSVELCMICIVIIQYMTNKGEKDRSLTEAPETIGKAFSDAAIISVH